MAKKAKKSHRSRNARSGKKSWRRWFCGLLGLAAATGAFLLGGRYISGRVACYPEFNFTVERVELDAAGCEWLPEEAKKQIESTLLTLPNLNLLSEGVLARVHERLVANPWVGEVRSIEKVFPDRIKFSLVLRRPVAWVSFNNRTYLTDSEGVRLPARSKDSLKIKHLPIIVGLPRNTSVPSYGGEWRSRRVAEGICVARHLLRKPDLLMGETGHIRSIDVSGAGSANAGAGRGVVLVTRDKRRIEWGRTQLSGKVRLLTDEQKLANLQIILKGESSCSDRSYYLLWTTPTAGPREKTAENPR